MKTEKTDFEKGQIVGLSVATKDAKTVQKMALEAKRRGEECFKGFESGMQIALDLYEQMLKEKREGATS
jgi:hypothetical protein